MVKNEAVALLKSLPDARQAVYVVVQEAIQLAEQRLLTCKAEEAEYYKRELDGARKVLPAVRLLLDSPKSK